MLFSSFEFILVFLPVVLALYFGIRSHQPRILMVLGASYVFYGFWNYKFIALLLFSTAVDFFLGIRIHETEQPRRRKQWLILSIVVNLGVLGFFKYFNFFAGTLHSLETVIVPGASPWFHLDVVLPIGISFYTFISLSYTIDVYLKRSLPHRDFPAYAGFVAFFPHLVAGPLIRHHELVHQLEDPSRGRFDARNFADGVRFFVIGLSKKILIADRLADGVNPVLNQIHAFSTLEAWLCAIGYSLQLYFDFSGYSDMAVGLARMLNIRFPQNFRSPYQAFSVTDFWQRWHITLSQWLRDYLYIPLGGNREGSWRTYRNLFLTMLLGGLWHGASWVFVIWGAYHGLWLALERLATSIGLSRVPARLPGFVKVAWVFLVVTVGWVFFRSPDLPFAAAWLGRLFPSHPDFTLFNFEPQFRDRFAIALAAGAGIVFFGRNSWEMQDEKWLRPRYAWIAAFLVAASFAFFSKKSPFLYFQF